MNSGYITVLLLIANLLVTYRGFKSNAFNNTYMLQVGPVKGGDYKRLITSGFLHAHWPHFLFNMITLYAFGFLLESAVGSVLFGTIYITSLLGSSAFVYWVYRKYDQYSAVGASGALSGIVNASIVLIPGIEIGIFFFLFMPAWVYGLGYTVYTLYKMYKKDDAVCHEGHFVGGLVGLVIAIISKPDSLWNNYISIASIVIPSAIYFGFYWKNKTFNLFHPFLSLRNYFQAKSLNQKSSRKPTVAQPQTPSHTSASPARPANTSESINRDEGYDR